MTDDVLLRDDDGPVRWLTLHRPAVRNAFDSALYHGLARALHEAAADDTVHVVVVTGAAPAFSSGQDLGEMAAIAAGDTLSDEEDRSGFSSLLDALVTFDKPLVAAVNGVAVGLGTTLLLHCDLVVVSDEARLKLPFATLGVAPEAGSSLLLAQRMGQQRANHMLLTGDWLSADEAVAYGLALEQVAAADLRDHVGALAQRIATTPLGSLRAIVSTTRAAHLDATVAAREREDDAFRELLQGWTRPAPE